jgi:ketosteroid isomerase-like protein
MHTTTMLRAETPDQVFRLFAESLGAVDLDAALGLFDEHAVLVPRPGEQVSGLDAIRDALAPVFGLRARMTGELQTLLEADGIAFVANRWRIEGVGPDGAAVALEGTTADVVRRQPDGRWLLLIDNPWGG